MREVQSTYQKETVQGPDPLREETTPDPSSSAIQAFRCRRACPKLACIFFSAFLICADLIRFLPPDPFLFAFPLLLFWWYAPGCSSGGRGLRTSGASAYGPRITFPQL